MGNDSSIDFQNSEPMSEYEICPNCLILGKEAHESIHRHGNTARSSIDSELICTPCYHLQKKPDYVASKISELSSERRNECTDIIDEFFRQRDVSMDRMDYM